MIAERGPVRPWSYFLRADTMHGLYSYLEDNPGRRRERFHEMSHGERLPGDWRRFLTDPASYYRHLLAD